MEKSEYGVTTPHFNNTDSVSLSEVIFPDNFIMLIKNSCNGNSDEYIMRVRKCAASKCHRIVRMTDLAEVVSNDNSFASTH